MRLTPKPEQQSNKKEAPMVLLSIRLRPVEVLQSRRSREMRRSCASKKSLKNSSALEPISRRNLSSGSPTTTAALVLNKTNNRVCAAHLVMTAPVGLERLSCCSRPRSICAAKWCRACGCGFRRRSRRQPATVQSRSNRNSRQRSRPHSRAPLTKCTTKFRGDELPASGPATDRRRLFLELVSWTTQEAFNTSGRFGEAAARPGAADRAAAMVRMALDAEAGW